MHSYTTSVHWYDLDVPNTKDFDDLEAAEVHGQQMGCLAGVRLVEVHSPDGTLQAKWDKAPMHAVTRRAFFSPHAWTANANVHQSNEWQRVGDESKALGRRIINEIATDW